MGEVASRRVSLRNFQLDPPGHAQFRGLRWAPRQRGDLVGECSSSWHGKRNLAIFHHVSEEQLENL